MRKIWIVIPFGRSSVSENLFRYVTKVNEMCSDVDAGILNKISEQSKVDEIYSTNINTFELYISKRLVCIVKKIEVNTQDFPETINAKIEQKAQPTSY